MHELDQSSNLARTIWKVFDCSSDQFSELVKAAELDDAEGEIVDLDLSGLDLRQQNFDGFNIYRASFEGSDISGASFIGASVDSIEIQFAQNYQDASLDKEVVGEIDALKECPPVLFKSIDQLNLSIRAHNCLLNFNIHLIGQLIQCAEAELLRAENFGRKSLNEVKEALAKNGLSLGTQVRQELATIFKNDRNIPEIEKELMKRFGSEFLENRYTFRNFRYARKMSGLTQKQLAEFVGLSRWTISRYERNNIEVVISGGTLLTIINAVGLISVDLILECIEIASKD